MIQARQEQTHSPVLERKWRRRIPHLVTFLSNWILGKTLSRTDACGAEKIIATLTVRKYERMTTDNAAAAMLTPGAEQRLGVCTHGGEIYCNDE